MSLERLDFEHLTEERRLAIAKSLRTVSHDEMKKMGEQLFKYADDPWREAYFNFIAEHPGATCHHAITSDGVNLLYCREENRGIWFLPGSGMGPLQARGCETMKRTIEAHR